MIRSIGWRSPADSARPRPSAPRFARGSACHRRPTAASSAQPRRRPSGDREGALAHLSQHGLAVASRGDHGFAETRVRKRLDDWAAAFRSKDIDHVMRAFTPDVVSFDVVPPLAYNG